ncbi:hypothetical protein [Methanobrevibacter sp. DSM 116169]|uniref:hypothetical protein n=1 Tax=Methanobrevibacter sp. DSM 116169 TaxID=3242727 RepID=UPI0038FCB318
MMLIAQNHLQLILEIGLMLLGTMIFTLNMIPMSLSVVTFLSLFLSGGFALLFVGDLVMLVLSFGQNEFTHPFGPIAVLAIVTAIASLKVMEDSGVNVAGLKKIIFLILILITIAGGLMHRSFLLLWLLGLLIGYFIISKSFRQKSILSARKLLMFVAAGGVAFAFLEILAMITGMNIFSPLLRISRIEENSLTSIKMVLNNIQLIGHDGAASFWGTEGTAFAEGYISLPMQLILFFGLPFPLFFGVLVNQKDTVDYMLPGIMGYGFDFGYLGLVGLMLFVLLVIVVGFKILKIYRTQREKNNKKFLGKEVLLIGSLSAFISQALIGLFIFNRTINGMALLTFIVLACLILAHIVTLKKR